MAYKKIAVQEKPKWRDCRSIEAQRTMATVSSNDLLFLLPSALLFTIGIVTLFAMRRLRRRRLRAVAGVTSTVFFLIAAYSLLFLPYGWALHLESKWRPANPKSRTELESHLSLYTKRDILPEVSAWGRDHKLQTGERMTRYSLLGLLPLDVVYTSDDAIVTIYTTYE